MWFVLPQLVTSTTAVACNGPNGWKWPAFTVGYLFACS